MTYTLKNITIRTNNTDEGKKRIEEVWRDIESGKLPILYNSNNEFQEGLSPVSCYSNYNNGIEGEYDLTIMGVTSEFFINMEEKVDRGIYVKYDETDENNDLLYCTRKAWERVWKDNINRSFTSDYESTVPKEYTKDGRAHCYLYIAVR